MVAMVNSHMAAIDEIVSASITLIVLLQVEKKKCCYLLVDYIVTFGFIAVNAAIFCKVTQLCVFLL